MNERIKELALKAYNNSGQNKAECLSSFMEIYSEKLAELIVKECAEIADKQWIDISDEENSRSSSTKIKEYFGVKE